MKNTRRLELCIAILPVTWLLSTTSLAHGQTVSGDSSISTVAGSATSNGLSYPEGVVADRTGALYIADSRNRRVLKMSPSGVISSIAGTGIEGSGGDGGPATAAQLRYPVGLAVEADGDLFIADPFDHRVRKVNSQGVISTVAGQGTSGFSGDNGPATAAQFNFPVSITVDAIGNLFVADYYNHRVRKVTASGLVSTIAGTGAAGSMGDGGLATAAQLRNPHGVAVDGSGNLYIAEEFGHRIRKVSPTGVISTVAGDGTSGFGGDNGSATSARLSFPHAVATDGAGNLLIADTNNHRIRKVTTAGIISTVAGNGTAGFSGDGGSALSASLNAPKGLAADSTGSLFIADTNNHRIRKVTASPEVLITYLNFPRPLSPAELSSTGFAILNPSAGAAAVMLKLFSANGTELASWSQTVGPKRQVAKLGSEFFPSVTAMGWIQLQTNEPTVQAFWVGGNFQTKVDGAEAAAARTDQIIPIVTGMTEVDIANPGSEPITVSARLISPSLRTSSSAPRTISAATFTVFVFETSTLREISRRRRPHRASRARPATPAFARSPTAATSSTWNRRARKRSIQYG